MTAEKEIRSYTDPSVGNVTAGIIGGGFFLMELISIPEGTFIKTLPMSIVIYLLVVALWFGMNRGTYISVDLENKTLNGSALFLPPRKSPIASITHIGVRGMFLSWTVMQITYQLPNGKKKTVGVGQKKRLIKLITKKF